MKRSKKKIFLDYLSSQGLKLTNQRKVILSAFLSCSEHVSADDVYQMLRVKHPNIGNTTVYRTLKLFVQSGIAREVRIGDNSTRYEQMGRGEHHDHLVCTRCHAITEFRDEVLERLRHEIASVHGFIIETHNLEMHGLCAACRS